MVNVPIDDKLYRDVEKWASTTNRSVQAVVEDAVRAVVPPVRPPDNGAVDKLPTFGGSGLQPGVDLEDRSGILDLMDEHENDPH